MGHQAHVEIHENGELRWRTCSVFQQSAIIQGNLYCSIGVTLMTVRGPLAQYIVIQCGALAGPQEA